MNLLKACFGYKEVQVKWRIVALLKVKCSGSEKRPTNIDYSFYFCDFILSYSL